MTIRYCGWCWNEYRSKVQTGKYQGNEKEDFGGMCRGHAKRIGIAPVTWKDEDLQNEKIMYASLRG